MQVPQEMETSESGLEQGQVGTGVMQNTVEDFSALIQEQQQLKGEISGFVQGLGDTQERATALMQKQQEPLVGHFGSKQELAGGTQTMQEQGDPMGILCRIKKKETGLLVDGNVIVKECSQPTQEYSRLSETAEPNEEQTDYLGCTVCTMDVESVIPERQACHGLSAEESGLERVALSGLNTQDTARHEVERSVIEPSSPTTLPDTDTPEELENELNAKKQKKKRRYKKKKRKKRSETPASEIIDHLAEFPFANADIGPIFENTPEELENALNAKKRKKNQKYTKGKRKKRLDSFDSEDIDWLSELPFVNADIGAIFGTPNEYNKPPKKKRKQKALTKKKNYSQEKQVRPNYFISLPIKNPKIVGDIEMIQDDVVTKDKRFSKAMVPQGSLHITLFVMYLANEEDVGRAINALSESKVAIEDILQGKLLVMEFEGVADFRNEVVYARLVGEDSAEIKLTAMKESMVNMFKEKGIQVKESKTFTPHLTFMKLSRSSKLRKQGIKKVDLKLYEDFKGHFFGKDTLTSLDLCSMQKKRQPSGYYHCDSSITFDSQEPPGTAQYVGTRTMMNSPSAPEQTIEVLPFIDSSTTSGKRALFGSTPDTSLPEHTRTKRQRKRISKAVQRELTTLRFKLNQLKQLLANPDTKAKIFKEVCGSGTATVRRNTTAEVKPICE